MAVTPQLIKELRERTGAGMMDCKKALEATEGNIEAAMDWLREKGISKAAKKAVTSKAGKAITTKLAKNKIVKDYKERHYIKNYG